MQDSDSEKTINRANLLCILLFIFGLTQMLGYYLDSKLLRGVGAAYLTSPMPKVFSDVAGLETFASKFTLIYRTDDDQEHEIPITPELYSKIRGPYKRRNVFGAALSYAPRLPEELWQPVFDYGFSGPLKHELELPDNASVIRVRIETKTASRGDRWIISSEAGLVEN